MPHVIDPLSLPRHTIDLRGAPSVTAPVRATKLPQLRHQEKGHSKEARAARQVLANHRWGRARQTRIARLTKVVAPATPPA
jgi:hypothetical protein